ncbi:gas vesicle protein G [Nonomuraea turkmeniaca]|uniref:Gas vesicle protein G n=1 Tax=Nonomuraea turkmeniaca TaxID=103838 RepID=A0A5S4FSY5_9ACTN|nr:gas vesicle protein GvpG [Nonomuraea turkmeniaca]TMR23866.1 gas vesicle protein G [Nonomuraea turkmeniaca]
MGLISLLFGWPLAPVKGVIRLGELIQEQAERQMHDPAVIRRRLEEIEELQASGAMSEEEAAREVELVFQRVTGRSGPASTGTTAGDEERG